MGNGFIGLPSILILEGDAGRIEILPQDIQIDTLGASDSKLIIWFLVSGPVP